MLAAIVGKGEPASGNNGHLSLALAAGIYAVVLGGSSGWARQELPVTVEAGVKKRVDGVVEAR